MGDVIHDDAINPSRILTAEESATLVRCESTIEHGLKTFVDVGRALTHIRDQRLYRQRFDTFEEYSQKRWNLSRPRAYQLIEAASTVSTIVDTGLPIPANEGQARELARVPEGERTEVWRETVERTDGRPTAAAVRETHAVRSAAAMLLHRAGYDREWIADHLGGASAPGDAIGITTELLDTAVAHLRAIGVTYYGVDDAAEKLRSEIAPPAPAPPKPEPGLWYGGSTDNVEPPRKTDDRTITTGLVECSDCGCVISQDGSGVHRSGCPRTPDREHNIVETKPRPAPAMLTLRTHKGDAVPYPKPQAKPTFNHTPSEGISWAQWSWNPVTGCLHGCDYCYARAIIHRYADANPAGFTPLFHEERLDAPTNTAIPERYRGIPDQLTDDEKAWRRVFVCSMADLYGRWVPDEWIKQVHASMLAAPQWEYLLLTKFPKRYVGLELPLSSWIGTSVDEQKRVRIAEDAFRQIDGVKVKWLSLEPLREPLEFTDLSMFDWVVIGAQTATVQPDGAVPAFAPPFEWVARIVAQAREAGCRVHLKPNLVNGRPGMQLPDEYPDAETSRP